jgi:hypothetical protein
MVAQLLADASSASSVDVLLAGAAARAATI